MTLERSVLLLVLTLAGLYVLPRLDAAYILLTLLFVWAAGQKL